MKLWSLWSSTHCRFLSGHYRLGLCPISCLSPRVFICLTLFITLTCDGKCPSTDYNTIFLSIVLRCEPVPMLSSSWAGVIFGLRGCGSNRIGVELRRQGTAKQINPYKDFFPLQRLYNKMLIFVGTLASCVPTIIQ